MSSNKKNQHQIEEDLSTVMDLDKVTHPSGRQGGSSGNKGRRLPISDMLNPDSTWEQMVETVKERRGFDLNADEPFPCHHCAKAYKEEEQLEEHVVSF